MLPQSDVPQNPCQKPPHKRLQLCLLCHLPALWRPENLSELLLLLCQKLTREGLKGVIYNDFHSRLMMEQTLLPKLLIWGKHMKPDEFCWDTVLCLATHLHCSSHFLSALHSPRSCFKDFDHSSVQPRRTFLSTCSSPHPTVISCSLQFNAQILSAAVVTVILHILHASPVRLSCCPQHCWHLHSIVTIQDSSCSNT